MKFEEIYSEIKRINAKDPATAAERLGKLFEEAGELAKAVNKTNGRKVLKEGDTKENIELEILNEAADTIQNVISVIDGFGWSYDHLMFALQNKNVKWEKKIDNKKI